MLIESNELFIILGYRITKQLYSGKKTLVYRAIREKDQQSVILKLKLSLALTLAFQIC